MDRRSLVKSMSKGFPTVGVVAGAINRALEQNHSTIRSNPDPPLNNVNLQDAARTAIYDVRAYGAFGDGETDDTSAINAAISAAGDRGGTVYFPSGTYVITPTPESCLLLISNVAYLGDGFSSCLKVLADAGDYSSILRPASSNTRVEHIRISLLRFDQNASEQTSSVAPLGSGTDNIQAVILAWNATNISVESCWFDSCCGVNTVIFNGDGFPQTDDFRVQNCLFRWQPLPHATNPDVTHRVYDNSAVYIVGRRAHVSQNTFVANPQDGARAACEFHGPIMSFTDNFSEGYQTMVNLGTMSPVPGDAYAEWIIQSNVGHALNNAIVVTSAAASFTNRLSIVGNIFQHDTAAHGLPVGNGIRISGDLKSSGATGQIDLSHNIIIYEPDYRSTNWDGTPLGTAENFAAILVAGPGILMVSQVTNNLIVNAPTYGLQIGSQHAGSVTTRVLAESNFVLNPGHMKTWAIDTPAFVNLEGDLFDVSIIRNTFVDEGVNTPIGYHTLRAFKGGGLKSALRVLFEDNTFATPNGAELHSWAADFSHIERNFTKALIPPARLASWAAAVTMVPLHGASVADTVTATPNGTLEQGLSYVASIPNTDFVQLQVSNHSADPVEMAERTWRIRLHRTMLDF